MKLFMCWRRGAEVIPFSLIACFFTCVGSTVANAAYAGWHDPLPALLHRVGVGYLGAVLVAVIVLPWLHAIRRRV